MRTAYPRGGELASGTLWGRGVIDVRHENGRDRREGMVKSRVFRGRRWGKYKQYIQSTKVKRAGVLSSYDYNYT